MGGIQHDLVLAQSQNELPDLLGDLRVKIAGRLVEKVDADCRLRRSRDKLFGRVHQDRPLKPIVIPIVFVQHAIKGADGDAPFCWIEPSGNGIRGYFIVVANEIETLDTFIMNSLRVLGPRMVDAETWQMPKPRTSCPCNRHNVGEMPA